jgi:AAA15 family ATPase/GTPase
MDRLVRKDPSISQRVVELLEPIVPSIDQVGVITRGDRKTVMFSQISNSNGRPANILFEAAAMSDGTLRMLAMIIATLQKPAPALMAFEEPEATIHPGALTAVSELIRAASRKSQIVLSTHSPDLLDSKWVSDKNIRLVFWGEGATGVSLLGAMPVSAIRSHLMSVGELLRANTLDAEPSKGAKGANDLAKVISA